jgi:hypothetical protein
LTRAKAKSRLKKQCGIALLSALVQQEDIMKLPQEQLQSEPATGPYANADDAMPKEISGYAFHPVRRASDTCPISRVPFASEYPPISPKIHELRERKLAELAAESRRGSAILK